MGTKLLKHLMNQYHFFLTFTYLAQYYKENQHLPLMLDRIFLSATLKKLL